MLTLIEVTGGEVDSGAQFREHSSSRKEDMAAQAVGSAVAEDESTVTSQRIRRQKASRKKGLTIGLMVCPLVTHFLKLL